MCPSPKITVLEHFHLSNARHRRTSFFSAPEGSLCNDYQHPHANHPKNQAERKASLLQINPLLRVNVIRF